MRFGCAEVVGFFGVVIFVVGLFTLEPTKVGFYSEEMVVGLFIIFAGFVMRKLDNISEGVQRLSEK